MAIDRVNDPRAFRDFLDAKLSNGGANLTLDQAFELWECENPSEEGCEETLEAIRRGLADVEAGRTQPLAEAFDEIRRDLGLPTDS